MSSALPPKGAERIAAYLPNLPDAPGVYRMLNAAGDVLYVGKAKNLKKRVGAYATGRVHSDRLTRIGRGSGCSSLDDVKIHHAVPRLIHAAANYVYGSSHQRWCDRR